MADLENRVTVLEVEHKNHFALSTDIKSSLDAMAERIRKHMEKEESVRWKIAAALIGGLFVICIGLITFIFTEAVA